MNIHSLVKNCLTLAAGLAFSSLASAQQVFPTPEKAADAFVEALGTQHADQKRLTELLGEEWHSFIPREGVQRSDVDAFLQQYREQHTLEKTGDNKAVLSVGPITGRCPSPSSKTKPVGAST